MQPTILQVAQLIVALSALVVSAGVSVIAYRGTKRIAEIQYWRGVRDSWMDIDKIALSNDEMLKMVDSLFHPDLAGQLIEDIRKRWFGYMAFNAFVSQYFGAGPVEDVDESGRRARVAAQLKPLMKDDVLYNLAQTGVYGPQFENLCRKLREQE